MYSGKTTDGKRYTFATSGLLYRSNKLMFDRQTHTLWSNLTGEPVVGPLVDQSIRLQMLPMTLTTWGAWRSAHSDTTVVRLDDSVGSRWGYSYRPGAANRARAGVSFPLWLKSKALDSKEEIYGLRAGRFSKAYPISVVLKNRIVNDRLADLDLVLIGEPDSGAIRAFQRNGYLFSSAGDGKIRDQDGREWIVTEEGLRPAINGKGEPLMLERVPGQVALWFAWFGFFPHTELYK